ncbi:MAG: ATP-binding protein [Gemmatimonadota bacterium]
MTLGVRIGLALIAPVVLLAGLAIYQLSVIDRLVDQNREIRLVDSRVEAVGVELGEAVARLAEFGDKMRALGDPAYEQAAEGAKRDIEAQIAALGDLPLEGTERRAVERLTAVWREVAVRESYPERPAIEDMHAHIDALIEVSREEARLAVEEGAAQAVRARRASIMAAASALLGAGLLALALVRMVVGPVRRVGAATRALARGEFSKRARLSGPPELAMLAEDFNAMAVQLGELDRLKEELLSNVSHDLKAPLASMHETNDLLLEEVPGPLTPPQQNLIRLNQGCNARLSKMVSDLLDLSRLQGGAMAYAIHRHDLASLARAGARDLAAVAEAREIRIDVEALTGQIWVDCDETLILRAIANLLSNAIRYSPDGGRIRVEVGPVRAGMVALAVLDQGPGVPDEHKSRIFERFYRVSSKHKGGSGTGIGLAIAKSILEGHGGTIRVEDAAGGGSRFVLELQAVEVPVTKESEVAMAATRGAV